MGGSIHAYFSYVTIPTSNGDLFVLHVEVVVREQIRGQNSLSHRVLIVDEGIDSILVLSDLIFQNEEKGDGLSTLEFDGVNSSSGSGARMVLISPDKEATFFSYRLEFNCTNNIAEYKALILCLNITIDMNIKFLHVRGDLDLIVSQVKKYFVAKNPRLKQYRNVVWDAIKSFGDFSIEAIQRERN
jgi:ribonuclease HI